MSDNNQLAAPIGMAPIERSEDFIDGYANNVRFEPTVYDLKIVFGETDLGSGKEVTVQHMSVTLPWALVKLALFFLEVNVTVHELENGKITIPPNQIPPPPPLPQGDNPTAVKAHEIIGKIREEFLTRL